MSKRKVILLPQDDGNREALKAVLASKGLSHRGEKVSSVGDILAFFYQHKEFFKGRVFLELLWEYQPQEAIHGSK